MASLAAIARSEFGREIMREFRFVAERRGDRRADIVKVGTRSLHQWPTCWLAALDTEGLPCGGRLEAIHILPRQRIRNAPIFFGADPMVIFLACWDSRLGELACTNHHRRWDDHMPPTLRVDGESLPYRVWECAQEKGLTDELVRNLGRNE